MIRGPPRGAPSLSASIVVLLVSLAVATAAAASSAAAARAFGGGFAWAAGAAVVVVIAAASMDARWEYDYSRSTEDNYAAPRGAEEGFIEGRFREHRAACDYGYHRHYTRARQRLQDTLMEQFLRTRIYDGERICERPTEPWVVFTAGAMGAGKSHTMQWLYQHELFPLHSYVHVDPDKLREMMPETEKYRERDAETAGDLTQKEAGYLTELLTHYALHEGKNALVDGSLRNADWYAEYFARLRRDFPSLKIAILHIYASEATVFSRARQRALKTGRVVPEALLHASLEAIPASVSSLTSLVDYVAHIRNEGEAPELEAQHPAPLLALGAPRRPLVSAAWDGFSERWEQQCRPDDPDLLCRNAPEVASRCTMS